MYYIRQSEQTASIQLCLVGVGKIRYRPKQLAHIRLLLLGLVLLLTRDFGQCSLVVDCDIVAICCYLSRKRIYSFRVNMDLLLIRAHSLTSLPIQTRRTNITGKSGIFGQYFCLVQDSHKKQSKYSH